MGKRTKGTIADQDVAGVQFVPHGTGLRQVVGAQRRYDHVEQQTGAGMKERHQRITGNPHPDFCVPGWPKAFCKSGVSDMETPVPSTWKVRWPCQRPSSRASRWSD